MREYEISDDNKTIGKVKIYNEMNIPFDSVIESMDNSIYKLLNDSNLQSYIINIVVNDEDDLYDKISIYTKDNILDEVERIKKYNNIKHIKKDTKLDIIIPSSYIKYFNKNINNIDLLSMLYSKIEFIKNVLKESDNKELKVNLNNIIISFNNYKNSSEYEFYTDDEKNKEYKKYNVELDKIINKIENITSYKFGKDYVTPIRIND